MIPAALLALQLALVEVKVGEPAPALQIVDAVNVPATPFDSAASQVRVLAFVRLEQNDSLFFLETIDALLYEFAFERVQCLAITNESKAQVEKTVQTENVPTPILIAAGDGGVAEYGIPTFPLTVIVDGAGKVRHRFQTAAPRDKLRDAVFEVLQSATDAPPLPAGSKTIAQKFQRWQLGDAAKALDKDLAKPKLAPPDKAQLEAARGLASLHAAKLAICARKFEKEKDWPQLVTCLVRLEKECAGLEGSSDAAKRLAALQEEAAKDAAFGKELSAAIDFSKAERFERERDWKKAHSAYSGVAKSAPETKAGKLAAMEADLLKSRAGVK